MVPASEAHLLRACKDLLDRLRDDDLLTYKRLTVSGVPHSSPGKKVFYTKNPMAGMPDIIAFLKNGPVLHLELKSRLGSLSEAQKQWRDELRRIGHDTYYVIKSIPDLIDALRDNGIDHWCFGGAF